MGKLRLMSNNVWKNDQNCPAWEAVGADCSVFCRAAGLFRVYNETRPDLIGLQECSAVMLEELMEHFAAAQLPYGILWGRDTPILYRTDRFCLVDSKVVVFDTAVPGLEGSFNNYKTKSFCIGVFKEKSSGKHLIFATVHLWWKTEGPADKTHQPGSTEARAYQIKQLLRQLAKLRRQYACPVVFVGDLNDVYASPAVRTALEAGYVHGYDVATEYRDERDGHHFCYAAGFDRYEQPLDFAHAIDHILLQGDVRVFRFERFCPEYYMPLSDHFPVWVDVEI